MAVGGDDVRPGGLRERPVVDAPPRARSGPVNQQELLREVYDSTDPDEGRRRLRRFYDHCRQSDVAELEGLARTIRRWEHKILAWHQTGLTNGPTEAVNLLVKKIKRVGHGFRNFDNYRLRLLLHCGVSWKTRTVAPMRARHPRLVA